MDILENQLVKEVIAKFAEPLMNRLAQFSKDEWEKFKIDFDIVFTKYLSKSYDKYCKIKTILYKTEPQYIYDFFVTPTLKKELHELVTTEDVNNILDISNFVIIQGTGGIGKSTLLKHLLINELEKKDLIPIFIELKDINSTEKDYTILDIILDKLNNLGSTINAEYIEYALESGCFLFLLDGYDEILTSKKEIFFKKFEAFCDKYSENYYIISSRPNSEFVEFQRFTVLTSMPLSKEQAIEMITKIKYEESIKEKFITELDQDLYARHTSFASNPLLLNIMLLTFENYADIPEKLHLFYSNAFETLYLKHDATKAGYKREMLSTLTYDSFRKIFAYFCFVTYTRGLLEFTHEELRELIEQIKTPQIPFETDNYIYDLANSLCVIYKDGLKYRFSHRSFQEYFTAVFLKELSDENLQKYGIQMIKYDTLRATHDNVFTMLHDMTEERFEKNILLPILTEIEENAGDDCYTYYLKDVVEHFLYRRDEEDQIGLWLQQTATKNSIPNFIYKFDTYYYSKGNRMKGKPTDNELYDYLINKCNYEDETELDYNNIVKDKTIEELFKDTWIGRRILHMCGLKEQLLEKQRTNNNLLDNIINFKDIL